MRRLTRAHPHASTTASGCLSNERGATTVIVAIMLVVLMGMAALAVDVGAMYAEKAQLQNGADAGALAIAGQCARGNCGDYEATGNSLANRNTNDAVSGADVSFPNANTVQVVTQTRQAGSPDPAFSLYFARVMGIESADIGAVAQASWGVPGTSLPWTVSECVFKNYLTPTQLSDLDSSGTFTGDPNPTHILLRYDTSAPVVPGCKDENGYRPGGFGWLEIPKDSTECSSEIDLTKTVTGQPGNHFPNEKVCEGLLETLMDEPALIPLFSAAKGSGEKTIYSLIGFGAFKVTGYKFSGSVEIVDPDAPACKKDCRGLQGYFVRFVSLEEGVPLSGGTNDYGGKIVALTK